MIKTAISIISVIIAIPVSLFIWGVVRGIR